MAGLTVAGPTVAIQKPKVMQQMAKATVWLESNASRHENAIMKELVPTPLQYGFTELRWVRSGLTGSPA